MVVFSFSDKTANVTRTVRNKIKMFKIFTTKSGLNMPVLPNCRGERVILLKTKVHINNTGVKKLLSISHKTHCLC
jgi:hypothetical protein